MAKINLVQSSESTAPEAPGSGRNNNIITQWPGKDNPLIVKLICDPTYGNGKKIYRPANYFTHATGSKESEKGNHICQTFFGEQSSPENDFFWKKVSELSALKKAGQSESTEAKKLKVLVKTFKPKKRGYILVAQPGSKAVQYVRVPESVIDILMGRKADFFNKEEIVSILDTMQAKGISPFNLQNTKGWLKLYKTGEKLQTKYHVELALVEKQDETKDGRKINYMDDLEASVHPHLLSDDFDTNEIPNLDEHERRFAFTLEESEIFVDALGTIEGTPARYLRNSSNQEAEESESPEAGSNTEAVVPEYQSVSEDDIPY